MIEVNVVFDEKLSKMAQKQSNKTLLKMFLFIILILVFLFFIRVAYQDDNFMKILTLTAIIIVSSLLFLFTASIVYLKILDKKVQKSNKLISKLTKINYTFYDTYFETKVYKEEEQIENSKIDYSSIYKLIESQESYMLYLTSILAHVIPKQNVLESDQIHLKEILTKNIKNYKKLK